MARTAARLTDGTRITDFISLGVVAKTFPKSLVEEVLVRFGKASERQRDLPAHVVVYYVIALGLFSLGLALLFKRRLTVADGILATLLAALIAHAKGPVGLIYGGLWMLTSLFLREEKPFTGLLTTVAVVLVVAWVTMGSIVSYSYPDLTLFEYIGSNTNLGRHLLETYGSLLGTGDLSWHTLLALVAIIRLIVWRIRRHRAQIALKERTATAGQPDNQA